MDVVAAVPADDAGVVVVIVAARGDVYKPVHDVRFDPRRASDKMRLVW